MPVQKQTRAGQRTRFKVLYKFADWECRCIVECHKFTTVHCVKCLICLLLLVQYSTLCLNKMRQLWQPVHPQCKYTIN